MHRSGDLWMFWFEKRWNLLVEFRSALFTMGRGRGRGGGTKKTTAAALGRRPRSSRWIYILNKNRKSNSRLYLIKSIVDDFTFSPRCDPVESVSSVERARRSPTVLAAKPPSRFGNRPSSSRLDIVSENYCFPNALMRKSLYVAIGVRKFSRGFQQTWKSRFPCTAPPERTGFSHEFGLFAKNDLCWFVFAPSPRDILIAETIVHYLILPSLPVTFYFLICKRTVNNVVNTVITFRLWPI